MYQSFLIKYAEIATKGKNRYLFEDALVKQIRRALKPVDGSFVVTKESGRIYAHAQGEYDYEETIEALSRVFGIVGICPVVVLEDQGFEQLKEEYFYPQFLKTEIFHLPETFTLRTEWE